MDATNDQNYICYCTNGHMINLKGRYVPSACPLCNAPMNLSSMSAQTAFSKEKAVDEHPPEMETKPIETITSTRPTQEPVAPPVANLPLRKTPVAPKPPENPISFNPPQRIIRSTPGAPTLIVETRGGSTLAAPDIQLDFFGEKIAIPSEGGWLGRSAIGSDQFEGYLLISREHVYVKPDTDGSLVVGPDKSLNGVCIKRNSDKITLQAGQTANLYEGDTLWLYNIPLKMERK